MRKTLRVVVCAAVAVLTVAMAVHGKAAHFNGPSPVPVCNPGGCAPN